MIESVGENMEHASIKKQKMLIFLCFLVYVAGYIGRYTYNSNINLIIEKFSISHADAGLVTTCFFFAYGAGQVIHGLLCKYYPKRYSLSIVLFLSAIINLLFFTDLPFTYMKWLWLLNGFLQASLWPSLMLTLSQNLDESVMKTGIVVMSLSSPIGMVLIYGASAFFAEINYKFAFLFAGITLTVVGGVIILFIGKVMQKHTTATAKEAQEEKKIASKKGIEKSILFISIILAIFALLHNFVKDGLQTWVPAILKESYDVSDRLSIILSFVLSALSIFGSMIAVYLNKKIKNYFSLIGLFFAIATVFIALILAFMQTSYWMAVVVCFAMVICTMHSINNVITAMAPLQMRDKVNSGMFAGILNGFCYLGSTISAYGLGAIADNSGWNLVFYLFFGLCLFAALASFVRIIIIHFINRKRKMKGLLN